MLTNSFPKNWNIKNHIKYNYIKYNIGNPPYFTVQFWNYDLLILHHYPPYCTWGQNVHAVNSCSRPWMHFITYLIVPNIIRIRFGFFYSESTRCTRNSFLVQWHTQYFYYLYILYHSLTCATTICVFLMHKTGFGFPMVMDVKGIIPCM